MSQTDPSKDLLSDAARDALPETLCSYLAHACAAFQSGSWLQASVFGTVFMEAFLDILADDVGQKPGKAGDFNGRIEQLRGLLKSRAINKTSLEIPDDILKRADEVRHVRNRLVHETGMPKTTLEADARQIVENHLVAVLKWYIPRAPTKRGAVNSRSDTTTPTQGCVPLFLSRITPHMVEQKEFLARLRRRLQSEGWRPVEVTLNEYDRLDPLNKVLTAMKDCHAVLVIGLERTHSYFCCDRRGSPGAKEFPNRKYTSAWMHMEPAMAYAMGKKVFVICEDGVMDDGVFDGSWNSFLPVMRMRDLEIDQPSVNSLLEGMREWLMKNPWQSTGPLG